MPPRRALSRRVYAAPTTPNSAVPPPSPRRDRSEQPYEDDDKDTLLPEDSISVVLPRPPARSRAPPISTIADDSTFGPLDYPVAENRLHLDEDEWRRRLAAPERGVTRRIELTSGNYVVDYTSPPAVINAVESRWLASQDKARANEFTRLRYTAITCDPADFTPANGYFLRQRVAGRPTELLIAVSIYNESRNLLAKTLHAIMLNIRDMVKHARSEFWSQAGWQSVVVTVVFDGLEPVDKTALDLLATLGCYQDGLMRKEVDGKETVAHLFEATTQLSLDVSSSQPSLIVPAPPTDRKADNLLPMQTCVIIKQKNNKKINTHRWVMDAIGRQLAPNVVCLVDVGTKPEHLSIYELWRAFHTNKQIAGCCGELTVEASLGQLLANPLVAAQIFEYKMSNHLSKPLEAAVGYISVLPGAFSAYRFSALQGRPLQQYFSGDHSLADRLGSRGIHGMSIFTRNLYLAEDRILCWELTAAKGQAWKLAYIRSAKAQTDVPETAVDFIAQRRRWLNGSLAANVYALVHFGQLFRTKHSIIRLFFLSLKAIYDIVVLVMLFFVLATIWLSFTIILDRVSTSAKINIFVTAEATWWTNQALAWIFAFFIGMQFILALGGRPKGERHLYTLTFVVFAILGLYMLANALILAVNAIRAPDFLGTPGDPIGQRLLDILTGEGALILGALVATFGGYIITGLLFRDPLHLVTCSIQYLSLALCLILVLTIYAISNWHDVSWGNKGQDKAEMLPAVASQQPAGGGAAVVEDVEKHPEDLTQDFKDVVAVAPLREKPPDLNLTEDDKNKRFRTHLTLVWLVANGSLCFGIIYIGGYRAKDSVVEYRQSQFFKAVLLSMIGISAFQLLGAVYFVLRYEFWHWLTDCCRRR